MGSVKRQQINDYRGLESWRNISLSDVRVIQTLVKNRSQLDSSFFPKMFDRGGIVESNGVFDFAEPVLVTYIDLDRLIETSPLSHMERFTVEKLMEGYTFFDLEEVYGISRSTFSEYFKRACNKIKETNDADWVRCVSKKAKSLDNYMTKGD